mgnify:CR=1 FL=1|tara:strand:+ start:566 stop:1564 length:999 start_codon:yes stop_codon:yes gene_type:complete
MASNFVPFFQGTDATNLINSYLGENNTANTPMSPADVNANNVFRNPYSPDGFYANDTDKYPVDTYKPPVEDENGIPNCEEGYVYDEVLKACRFVGFSEPSRENQDNGKSFEEERAEERDYFSIDKMKNLSDKDLIEYLKDGRLSNSGMLGFLPSKGDVVTIKDSMLTSPLFKLAFGKQEEMRRQFMIDELTKRGFNIGTNEDGQQQFNINPILYKENLDSAVDNINIRQNDINDYVPVVKEDGTIGYKFVDRTSGDFYKKTEPSRNLGSLLLSDSGFRNDQNYNNALRENIRNTVLAPEQTISYTDNKGKTYTAKAPRSNYSSALGGFTGGR